MRRRVMIFVEAAIGADKNHWYVP